MNYLLSLAENEYVEYICLMMVVARSGNLIPSAFKDFVERKVKNKTLLLNISNLLKSSNDGNDFLNAYAKFVSKQSGGLLSDLIGLYFIRLTIRHLSKVFFAIKFNMTAKSIKNYILNNVINFIKSTPILSSIISSKFSSMEKDIEKELKSPLGDPETRERFIELPQNGLSDNEILSKMQDYHAKEAPRWKDGFVSGAVYNGEEKMLNLQVEAYKLYSVSNPLHADLWPSVMKFEAEIIAMTANLLNGGDKNVCGAMTSGGTESILMAAKTHREWFLREHGITQPEIIAPQTAHAAIDKACEILGIKLIHAPVDPVTRMVIVSEIRARITKDTIMIYSSAPQFPHGIIDPIDKLSEIAYSYGIGLHVDCCLGGFILPFGRKLQKLGMGDYGIPAFDFELRGVTSMSVDTHKYAYAPKGTSVVLYRSKNIRKYQYFAFPKWPGGLYVTPATPGSRPGGLSAGCWASMLSMGETGYLNATKSILDTVQDICKGLQTIEGVQIIGKPCAMIVAIASERFNIYDLNHKLHKRGWVLNSLQNPACIHLCVTLRTVPVKEKFVNDVRESAIELLASGSTKAEGGSAPIYGMASVLPEGPIEDMLRVYTDVTLKP